MCAWCVCVVDFCVIRLLVNKRTRTCTLTCSRSYFYLRCTHTKRYSHKIQREQNGESWGVCARVEKRDNVRGERDGEERAGEGQRDRETERQRE
jgi:hypothetical protein